MSTHARELPVELKELLPPRLHARCANGRYARGTTLFETGRRPAFMFYVVSGEVTLERHGIQGEPVVLQRCRRGFVGEASLHSSRYHCDARVVTDADIIRIPLRELGEALDDDPSFAVRWIGMLNREVRRLRQQCERLSLKTVEARLLHLLDTEGSDGGYRVGAGLKSIAREIGVTHEALYRCVASLEGRGILNRIDGCLRRSVAPPREGAHRTRQAPGARGTVARALSSRR